MTRWLPAIILVVGAVNACATWATTGSVLRTPCTHVGARLHSDDPRDLATTVQVSTDFPYCREVYR